MNTQFQQTTMLIGVVGKKGSGTLDGGQAWETDRIELHCIAGFDESDTMSHGKTVVVHQVQDYLKHYDKAKSMLDQQIVLTMSMIAPKKLGAIPKITCVGFELVHRPQKQA